MNDALNNTVLTWYVPRTLISTFVSVTFGDPMLSSDSIMRSGPSLITQTWGNRVDLPEVSEDSLPSNDPFIEIENVEAVPSIKFLASKHVQKTRKSTI